MVSVKGDSVEGGLLRKLGYRGSDVKGAEIYTKNPTKAPIIH
jgi:hypothetical protein